MFLQIILLFSFLLFIFVICGRYNVWKMKITNFLLITYFIANIILGINGFQNEINLNFIGHNLFHISIIESIFLILFGIVGIGVSFYSNYYFGEYIHHKKNLNFYYIMMLLFVFAMQAVIISSNAILFLIMWEIMSLSSYFLVIHEYKEKGVFEGGNYYLIIAHVGMFFILLSFIPFILSTGSYDFLQWSGSYLNEIVKNLIFFGALIGFGAKAGIWPLHIWLPKAHPIAPSNISALMSGFMVKLPIMMLIKFIIVFFAFKTSLIWGIVLIVLGSITAFLGIFYSIVQNDIKKILAFSTIENVGFMITMLGIFVIGIFLNNFIIAVLGLTALLYHISNHAVCKTLMFLIAGGIIEKTQTRDISKMGGFIKVLPLIGFIALIGVLTISGIPPLALFNSEIIGFMGIIQIITKADAQIVKFIGIFGIILIALMSVFAFISFSRLFTVVFLGRQRNDNIKVGAKADRYEIAGYSIYLIMIILLSIFPGIFTNLSNYLIIGDKSNFISIITFKIGEFVFYPIYFIVSYIVLIFIIYGIYKIFLGKIKKIEPWNCGYKIIPHDSQYSPESVIQPIRRVYNSVYMQTIDIKYNEYYKKQREKTKYYFSNIYFTNIIYDKIIGLFMFISEKLKSLQNGILQYYIGYIFGILLLMIIVLYFTL